MRSGSTWLYQVLRCHPDIRLSDRKEMNFFFMREMLHHDLDWYEAHFEPGNGGKPKPVRGEISPLYARLKAWQVRRIADLLPDLRIILTLRHPIERVWSQALLEFGYLAHRDLSMIGYLAFLRQVERARNMLSSDYGRTIRIWSEAFRGDALHIDFFDRLRTDPERYVNGVLRHIGARTPWAIPAKFMKTKVHATNSLVGQNREIPEVVRWYIADRLLEPTERLNELLKGKVSGWVDEMRTIRGKTRLSWRIMREVNRAMLSVPERLAYEAYHVILDVRLWWRWRQFQRLYVRDGTGAIHCASSVLERS
jgi:Sulfotransferase family